MNGILSTFGRTSLAAAIVAVAAMGLAACGSGGDGNTISGNVSYSGNSSARINFYQNPDSLEGTQVQLVDADGEVVNTVSVNADGNYTFTNVAEGDYSMVFVNGETGDTITEVNISILEGDDAEVNGSFTDDVATWEVSFESNTDDMNDTQAARVDKFAELTGMSTGEIADLRASGMGWGQIAHELGIHPGNLGMGHSDGFKPNKSTKADPKGKKDKKGKGKPEDNPGKGKGGKK